MELKDLQNGMQVQYQFASSREPDYPQTPRWSSVRAGSLYVMRRDEDLPKRLRSRRDDERRWRAGHILVLAAPGSAEFDETEYFPEHGYFFNGESHFLRIVGLGDEAFHSAGQRAEEQLREIREALADGFTDGLTSMRIRFE